MKKALELRALIIGEEEITPELEEMFVQALDLVLTYHSKSTKDKKDRVIHSSINILSDINEKDKEDMKFLSKLEDNYFYHTKVSQILKQEWDTFKQLKEIPEEEIQKILADVNSGQIINSNITNGKN